MLKRRKLSKVESQRCMAKVAMTLISMPVITRLKSHHLIVTQIDKV